jgi:N-acetylneuraminic acid mutarotase
MSAPSSPAAQPPLDLHGWQLLAPLPDPVGYGGMFAATLNGRLVTGGGSQFREKPNWLNGEKTYSDRLFTLADPAARWTEHTTRLPLKMGHFACATTSDAIYLVGGSAATGALTQAWQLRAKGDDFQFTPLPDFPHPVVYAIAGIAGNRLYVIGGLPDAASKSPTTETWSLDLSTATAKNTAWRREPDLPGPGVFVSCSASDGAHVYVLGGMNYDAESKPTPSKAAYRFSPARNAWEKLADLPEPRVSAASPAPVISGDRIFVIGGYAVVFPGPAREYPYFRDQTYYYDIKRNTWANGPILPKAPVPNRDSPGDPGPAPMIAAPATVWQNRVVVVSGEARASVRTPAVVAWPLNSKQP